MIIWTPAVFGVLHACILYFCICTCSAQLSMFHMERRSRNMLIIIVIINIIVITIPSSGGIRTCPVFRCLQTNFFQTWHLNR